MNAMLAGPPRVMWPVGRVIVIRLVIYAIVGAFFLQYRYFFGEGGAFYAPLTAVLDIAGVFALNLLILFAGSRCRRLDPAIAATYAVDILLITRIVLISGGLHSLFIPFYLPVLIMAPAWLPRSFTAIFPSLATLGIAYIGLAHIMRSLEEEASLIEWGPLLKLYSPEILKSLRVLPYHLVVASMLTLSALVFVISYISSAIGAHLLSLSERMEEAERNLSRFSATSVMAAGLAHEIRNPLASLRGSIQEIGEFFPAGSQNRVLTDIVIAESDRLDRVISRFLDFSREESLRPAPCRLGSVLADIRTMLMLRPDAGGLEAVLTVNDDPLVVCDADRVREIFLNLALNAAQAIGGKSGGRLEITLGSMRRGMIPGAGVVFRDNGPGIDPQTSKRMFDPFFSSKPNGGGMGLALSRKHVSMHGGCIEVENNPGGGASFLVWLPMNQLGGAKRESLGGDTILMVNPRQGKG